MDDFPLNSFTLLTVPHNYEKRSIAINYPGVSGNFCYDHT